MLKPKSPDNVYVNARISNQDSNRAVVPAVFSATRTSPIVDKGSDYYVSVISADLPAFNLPTYIPEIIVDEDDPDNINKTAYVLGFVDNLTNTGYPVNAQFIPTNNATNAQIQNPNNIGENEYYFGTCYSSLLESFNRAIAQSFTDIGVFAGDPPFFRLDHPHQRIMLIVPAALRTQMIGGGTEDNPDYSLAYNYVLDAYFNSFNVFYDVTSNAQLAIRFVLYDQGNICNDIGGNEDEIGGTSFYYAQEFYTLNVWNPVKKILVYTNSIHIKNTSVTQPVQIIDGIPRVNEQLADNSPLLLTFDPVVRTANQYRTTIYYRPEAQYQLVDILGDTPIYKIDLRVYWMDYNGKLYTLNVKKDQIANIHLGFFKKSLYKL